MAIPVPRSYNQILGDMVNAFLSRFGLKSLKVGSATLSALESAAQSDLRSSQDTFDLLNATSLDHATGLALDRIGLSEDVPRLTESASTGPVTISDTSFVKVVSRVYQGLPAPIVGSNKIYVADASGFSASGSVYVGRGTNNYEGPLTYTSKVNNGTYWTLNLSGTTQKFHNLGETVILAQGGNRVVNAGTIVQTPQGNALDAVQFSVLYQANILDGETEVLNVQVVALRPGVISNVSAGAVRVFPTAPFPGASVTNALPFTNGQATEDDQTYRERIRSVRRSRAKGTALALTTAVQGIVASDENKRVTSSSLVTRQGYPTTLYIDDGTGYEERSEGVALEKLIDVATGGEQFFQVSAARPIAKASLVTEIQAPFALTASSQLAVKVGGVVYVHSFDSGSFRSISNATAYEVAASINSDPLIGFSAATSDSGTRVRIFAKADTLEDIQTTMPVGAVDANLALGFPGGRIDTMLLYKNDRLLSKDGMIAAVTSKSPSLWGSLSSGETLTLAVDGTPAVTYTFVDQDFIDANTGYSGVGRNSVAAWAAVFESKIPGISCRDANGILEMTSNAGPLNRASIAISGGSLVTPGQMFAVQTVVGTSSDYTLNRNTGQIRLETPLAAGDSLSIGTLSTRAFLQSSVISATTISGGAKVWFAVDGDAEIIGTGLNNGTNLSVGVQRLETWGNRVRISSGSSVFSNIRSNDWMISWDPSLNLQGTLKVAQATGTYAEIERVGMQSPRFGFTSSLLLDGRVLVVGGQSDNGVILNTCEIYNPTTQIWSSTGSLTTGRWNHTATLLSNGKVLVVGGENFNLPGGTNAELDAQVLNSCELYDPVTGLWTVVAPLPATFQRTQHVAGLLTAPTERAIVVGGRYRSSGAWTSTSSAFIYEESIDSWTQIASITGARYDASGVILSGGDKFLVFGGVGALTSSQLYDWNLTTWSASSALNTGRSAHRSVLLASGKVLTTGGDTGGGTATNNSEIYDPAGAGTWSNTTGAMNSARRAHSIALMGNNKVLVAFGQNAINAMLLSAETFDPATGLWTTTATPLSVSGRARGHAVRLNSTSTLVFGGSSLSIDSPGQVQASAEIYTHGTNSWSVPNQLTTQTSLNLSNAGLVFVRADAGIQQTSIGAGTNLTASSFVSSLNSQLQGAFASTFRTNRMRVTTNTYALGGDIALVSRDIEGVKLGIDVGDAVENTVTHLAQVQAGNTQAGTPEFTVPEVLGAQDDNKIVVYSTGSDYKSQNLVVGLKSLDSSYNTASPLYRRGHNANVVSAIQQVDPYLYVPAVTLRQNAVEWIAKDRFMFCAPYSIGPRDNLVIVVDQDTDTKRFNIPMYRRLAPTGSYGSTITVKDRDNASASLAVAFGLNYSFNDFAVYMQARTKTHTSDSTKTILWRYVLHGADGNAARVRYVYPNAPSQTLSVATDTTTSKYTNVSVTLPSGALKTGYSLRNGSRIGTAAATGTGGLTILSYVFGYSVASATRDKRLKFKSQTVDFGVGETITGAISGATATILSQTDSGATGILVIGSVTGTFNVNEAITGSLGGAATTDGSQYDQVALTLTLPTTGGGAMADITNHGFIAGNGLYLSSANANFPSGLKTLTEVTSTTVSYIEFNAFIGTAASIGNVSFDPAGEVSLAGATPSPVAVSDLFRVETTSGLPTAYENNTIRIGYYSAQAIQGYAEGFVGSITGTPTWSAVGDAASVKVFGLNTGTATATQIASAVQSLAGAVDSICPVTATVTGSGSGVINKSSAEEALSVGTWFQLADGVNYVKSTTAPGSLAGDYQLTFKNQITSSLTTASDWTNEDVRIAPITTPSMVSWLNTLAVSGLSSVCAIEASDKAQRPQIASATTGSSRSIQVQGGHGNSASAPVFGATALVTDPDTSTYAVSTVRKSDTTGLTAGMWVKIQNTTTQPKSIFTSATELVSWGSNGVMTLAVTPLWTYANSGPILSKTWQVEKHGRYICYRFNPYSAAGLIALPSLTGVKEGDWVVVDPAVTPTSNSVTVSTVNRGRYRVIRVEDGTVSNAGARAFWIENANAVEETSEMDVAFYSFNSVMPGDAIVISTDFWGSSNKGTWTVEAVGQASSTPATSDPQFVSQYKLKVSTSPKVPVVIAGPGPGALGSTNVLLIQVLEGQLGSLVKRIRSICPNQTNGQYVDMKFETSYGYNLINAGAGSVISALDKLAFPTDLIQCVDGYAHNTGLIAEANRVVYGDSRDTTAYPGVAAAGSNINIAGPLVKRISVSLNIRMRTGVNIVDVTDRIKSAVAATVNKAGVGKPVAISDIVAAATKVNGVVAVSVISPAYAVGSDLIPVQPFEKPLVLNLDQDVLVSFAGD